MSQQRHGVRSLRLQELAADSDAEAATWRLLAVLHGIPEMSFPGGLGGPRVEKVGDARHTQQRAAGLIERDAALNR